MIEFKNVYIKHVEDFYSLYNFNKKIIGNTLLIENEMYSATSIMRILSKIDKHYQGDILINEKNLKEIKNKDLDIAYLPQNPVLFKDKNLFKNLFYPLKIRKIDKKTAKNLINSIFLELKNKNFNFLNNYLSTKNNDILKIKIKNSTFSEQKIIALIRAILRKPKYILLENFFENLDVQHHQLAEFLIKNLINSSTIIASEKQEQNVKVYANFTKFNF